MITLTGLGLLFITKIKLADPLIPTGFTGKIEFDATKPDGTPRKLMNVDRLDKLGWKADIQLEEGLASTYQWFLDNQNKFRQ